MRWNNLIAFVNKPSNTIQFSNQSLLAYETARTSIADPLQPSLTRETEHIIQLIEHKDKVTMAASWYRADPVWLWLVRALTIITQNKALSLTPARQKYLITRSTAILCGADCLTRWEPHTCFAKEGYYHNCLSREWRSGRVERKDIFNPHTTLSCLRSANTYIRSRGGDGDKASSTYI